MSNRFLLEAKNIIKTFPPTVALNDVHFCLRPGEIHGLMGENGSGKSTMCSIVSGIYPYDSGELFLDGEPYCPKNMIDAAAKGVCMIVQEQGTFASTTVAENIFIGKEKQFHNGIRLDTKKMANAAQKILDELQMQHIDARMTCGRLSFEDRKLVEIARAMYSDPKVLIIDETTSALSKNGRDILYGLMEKMKSEGKSVIFISHDIDELMEKCDYLTVFRDGIYIDEVPKEKFNPEWRIKDIDGHYSRDKGRRFGLCCPNSEGYKKFCRDQIADFTEYVGPYEAFFADMTFWPTVCYCDNCRARWEKEVGGEMPRIVNWKDERWKLFQRKREEWLQDYMQYIYDSVKMVNPGAVVEMQNSTMPASWMMGVTENATIASDAVSGDLYGGFSQQTFACKLYYNMTPNLPFNYTTSRCEPSLDEHTTIKSEVMMKLHAMLSFINHGSNIFVDAVDMTGTYEPLVYSRLKNVYDDAARFEKYFSKGKPCTDIGIYFNLHGKYDEETPPMDISESKHISRAIPHLDSSINVSETLQRAHIPYSVYTSFHPEQWGKAKMLIVSDAPNMSKENMSELKAYVEDGGIAYISGHSAQPLVEEIFGGKITGRTDETITYIAPEDEVASLFGEYSRKYPLTVYDSAYILEGATNGKVLAKLTLPYSLQASSFLVCADLELQVEADPNDPRNESASMHSDPPGIATDYPAMMEAEVGKGKIIWVCAPFENTSLTQPRKVFTSFVKKYVPEMRFASDDTPYVVEYQLWEDEEGKYLSAINLQYADEVLPVFDFNICIRTEKPAKITRVSDGREMGFEYSDGKLVLHIDRLDLYEMFDIQI